MNKKQISEACYNANRIYCQSIGDNTLPSWDRTKDKHRVDVLEKVKIHLANPGTAPKENDVKDSIFVAVLNAVKELETIVVSEDMLKEIIESVIGGGVIKTIKKVIEKVKSKSTKK